MQQFALLAVLVNAWLAPQLIANGMPIKAQSLTIEHALTVDSEFKQLAGAAIHADALLDHPGFSTAGDVSPPISLSTTFACPDDSAGHHVYARISNPTRERCEALLGAVEGASAPLQASLASRNSLETAPKQPRYSPDATRTHRSMAAF